MKRLSTQETQVLNATKRYGSPPPPPDLIRYEMLGLLKVLNIVADNKIGYYFKFIYKIHINMVYIYMAYIYILAWEPSAAKVTY